MNVGAAYHVFREHGLRHLDRIAKRAPGSAPRSQLRRVARRRSSRHCEPGGLRGVRTREGVETGLELAGAAG